MGSIRFKTGNLTQVSKFDTDSRGSKPKATDIHLVGARGDPLPCTLAPFVSLDLGNEPRTTELWVLYDQNTKFGQGVPSLTPIPRA